MTSACATATILSATERTVQEAVRPAGCFRRLSVRRAPDGELGSARLPEVKPPAAGEVEWLDSHRATRCLSRHRGFLEVLGANHNERCARLPSRIGLESEGDAAALDIDVIRSVWSASPGRKAARGRHRSWRPRTTRTRPCRGRLPSGSVTGCLPRLPRVPMRALHFPLASRAAGGVPSRVGYRTSHGSSSRSKGSDRGRWEGAVRAAACTVSELSSHRRRAAPRR